MSILVLLWDCLSWLRECSREKEQDGSEEEVNSSTSDEMPSPCSLHLMRILHSVADAECI